MTCPTSGDALERIACELHVMNEPTAFGWVPQLAPLATVLLSLLAFVYAVRSFLLARQAHRVTRATTGREVREQLRQRAEKVSQQRWGGDVDLDQTSRNFRRVLQALRQSSEKNGRAIAIYLQSLDDVFRPSPDADLQRVSGRHPRIAATAMLDAWVEDPWDLRTMERAWVLTLRTPDPSELQLKLYGRPRRSWIFGRRPTF